MTNQGSLRGVPLLAELAAQARREEALEQLQPVLVATEEPEPGHELEPRDRGGHISIRRVAVRQLIAEHQVEVTASLPHYRSKQTDSQRGDGVFEESIEALLRLNALGYGMAGTGLVLNLVTNPVGTFLPGNQASLESEWKRQLRRLHGIEFNSLYTITNLPISRFLEFLEAEGRTHEYLERLASADCFGSLGLPRRQVPSGRQVELRILRADGLEPVHAQIDGEE